VTITESCVSDGCSRLSITVDRGMALAPIARLRSATATSAATARPIPAVRVTRRRAKEVVTSVAVAVIARR
jgi:hypothetical protein